MNIIKIAISLSLLFCSNNIFASDTVWRNVDNSRVVLMTLPHGEVVIELAPQFSPNHVKQFIELVKGGHYNNNTFYRVIDGFVAQAGPSNDDKTVPTLNIEDEWKIDDDFSFTKVQSPDLFAEHTGFKDGFAIGTSDSENKAWLTHCPGIIAMARSNKPNSGTSHFYITNGQAPRYLDRIMSIFGRVIYGMENVHKITRTQVVEGDAQVNPKAHTRIISMQLMSDLPVQEQWHLQVEDTDSNVFAHKIFQRKNRTSEFFYKKPPPVLDVCQVPVATKVVTKNNS